MHKHLKPYQLVGSILLALGASTQAYSATLFVTSSADSGAGTLRDAVGQAVAGDVIVFDITQTGNTINLQTPINLDVSISIDGPGANLLNIDGGGTSSHFSTDGGAVVTMAGLTLSGGSAADGVSGGSISVASGSALTLVEMTFEGNQTSAQGGALFNDGGNVVVQRSLFTNNLAGDIGGAIFQEGDGAAMTLIGATIEGNTGTGNTGGIGNFAGTMDIIDSTIVNNTTPGIGGGIALNVGAVIGEIRNTIVANNSAGNTDFGLDVGLLSQDGNDITSTGGNLIGVADSADITGVFNTDLGDQFGTNDAPLDPLLTDLQDNGGPTFSLLPLANSPAVDTGLSGINTDSIDQRGVGRISGADIDVGAVERQIVSIGPEISGSWIISGLETQGFLINAGEDTIAPFVFLAWFTFDEAGAPLWLSGIQSFADGFNTTDQLNVPVQRFEGPTFLQTDTPGTATDVGSLNFTVTDCDTLQIEFDLLDLGAGKFTATRLTNTSGVECAFDTD